MDADLLRLMVDLHVDGVRQGPGSAEATGRALSLTGLEGREGLKVLDAGSGTGASAEVLAGLPDPWLWAVDPVPAFLRVLRGRVPRTVTVAATLEALPFREGTFDLAWSEGAVYNVGFRAGVDALARVLVPGGVLAVSDLTWLTGDRPAEVQTFWETAYPEVGTASERMAVLEARGLEPLGYFPLPSECWSAEYYAPLVERLPAFLARHEQSEMARTIVADLEAEIEMYARHGAYYGYGMYVARRPLTKA